MNEIIAREALDNTKYITSIEIAELTGKMHKDVMKAIRNMEPAWESERGRKFALSQIREKISNNGYKLRPCYLLTKTESLFFATKFNDEARARLIIRWEQLERERIQQTCVRRLLVSDSDVMDEAERIVGRKLMVSNEASDDCLTMTDIAKLFNMKAGDMNSFLCDMGIQSWSRGQYRLREQYEGQGLAEDRLFIYYSREGKKKERTYLVWTRKGLDFIEKLINQE